MDKYNEQTVTTLICKLRGPTNWLSQGAGRWKETTSEYDSAPYEAAEAIRDLWMELKRQITEREKAIMLLRAAINNGHIYGNDSERWLIKAEKLIARAGARR